MKTKILFFAISFVFAANSFAQTPDWQWAKSNGCNHDDGATSVATDASGNILVVGYFYNSSITFGSTTLSNTAPNFYTDIFIVKYDVTGNVLWAKSAGGDSDDNVTSVATDASSNILVAGSFGRSSTITFGTTTLSNTSNSVNMFIVKYDATGNVLWAKSADGNSVGAARSVTTDAYNNILLTGTFALSSIIFGTDTLSNAGFSDMYIAKYDSTGNVLWAKSTGGNYGVGASSIVTDILGNIIVGGYFSSSSIIFGSTTLTNVGNQDMFIAKYDAIGNVLWAKSAGGNNYDGAASVTTDVWGNVIIAGAFQNPSITFGSTTLINVGNEDMFIVKYDTSGNVLWAKSAGDNLPDGASSVSSDASGNIVLAGWFSSSSITFGTTTLINAGSYGDIFIVKYEGNGNVLWAKSVGGNSYDGIYSLTIDVSDNILMAGEFRSPTIIFGSDTLSSVGISGGYDMIVAKLSSVTGMEIPSAAAQSDILIYPNPSSGKFTVSLCHAEFVSASNQTLKQVQGDIAIYNVLGEKAGSWQLAAGKKEIMIDISSQPEGIYFIQVKTEQGVAGRKLIIQK